MGMQQHRVDVSDEEEEEEIEAEGSEGGEDGAGAVIGNDYGIDARHFAGRIVDEPTSTSPSSPPALEIIQKGIVQEYLEVWDYVGGHRFRAFTAQRASEKALVVFFDSTVVGGDLKAGLMALLELCAIDELSCSRLVVAIDRGTPKPVLDVLSKDLGWIGFQLTTLREFAVKGDVLSEEWLFMEMDA